MQRRRLLVMVHLVVLLLLLVLLLHGLGRGAVQLPHTAGVLERRIGCCRRAGGGGRRQDRRRSHGRMRRCAARSRRRSSQCGGCLCLCLRGCVRLDGRRGRRDGRSEQVQPAGGRVR
ncbi:hypothetical protein BC831DRAFT_482679 [Entophlyctis helioformis]|nr:hypothetical protein BC831DRAFT_482679 [Entophlyctis helioformis]